MVMTMKDEESGDGGEKKEDVEMLPWFQTE